jgi:hypothetical protein
MAKERVFSQFGPGYQLSDYGAGFVVIRKPLTPSGDFDSLGTIQFADGKLKSVSKSWVFKDDIESFWRGLYGSIAGAIGSQLEKAVVYTRTAPPQPNFTQDNIFIVLKGRTIRVSRMELGSERRLQYSVDEEFGE